MTYLGIVEQEKKLKIHINIQFGIYRYVTHDNHVILSVPEEALSWKPPTMNTNEITTFFFAKEITTFYTLVNLPDNSYKIKVGT